MITGKHGSAISVRDRFTDDTNAAIIAAKGQAQSRGSASVTVSDLLAGLGQADDSRAVRVGSLKANAFYLRWLMGLPPMPMAAVANQEIAAEMSADAYKALSFAVAEADRDREYRIDSDHLLRGLLRFPNNADFALLKTELNLQSAREGSRIDREEYLPEDNPSLKVIAYLFRKHFALWVPPILSLACYLYILIQSFGIDTPLIAR